MKLLRVGPPGQERPAVLAGDGTARDVSAYVRDFDLPFFASDGLVRLREGLATQSELPGLELTDQRVGAPVAEVGDLLCVGLNYADHAAEAGMALPDEPIIFSKKRNALSGPNDPVLLPPAGEKVDWEIELGVFIGRRARYLPDEQAAADVIAGYCIANDVSERAFQLERGGQWVKGKSCETFNPLGPWLVTPDEVGDPQALSLSLLLNGELMQAGTTATMIFGVRHLVWYLSQFMVLEPGDLVNTGTPPGVGMARNPPRFLRPGDVMELEITGLGTQRQRCEPAPPSSRR